MIPAHPIASAYWGCLWFGPVPGPVFSFGISQNITGNWWLSLPLDNVSTSFRSTLPLLWPELLHIGHIVLGGALPTNRIFSQDPTASLCSVCMRKGFDCSL